MDACIEGHLAALLEQPLSACPYSFNPERLEWRGGWATAHAMVDAMRADGKVPPSAVLDWPAIVVAALEGRAVVVYSVGQMKRTHDGPGCPGQATVIAQDDKEVPR